MLGERKKSREFYLKALRLDPSNADVHNKIGISYRVEDKLNKAKFHFKNSILGTMILSPLDLEEKFGLTDGDIMHGQMTLDQMWAARPILNYGDYRGPLKSLYMCGSGTHPGGGVTGLPGRNAAREILKDG